MLTLTQPTDLPHISLFNCTHLCVCIIIFLFGIAYIIDLPSMISIYKCERTTADFSALTVWQAWCQESDPCDVPASHSWPNRVPVPCSHAAKRCRCDWMGLSDALWTMTLTGLSTGCSNKTQVALVPVPSPVFLPCPVVLPAALRPCYRSPVWSQRSVSVLAIKTVKWRGGLTGCRDHDSLFR